MKSMEKSSEISEDNYHRALDNIQELTDQYIKKIDRLLEEKTAEVMEV